MRNAYAVVGTGFVILIGAMWAASRQTQTPPPSTAILTNSTSTMSLTLTSSAFAEGGSIPSKYTCDGDPPAGGVNPPLSISGVPVVAKTLALIVDDPDVPKQIKPDGIFDHWVLFNIPATTTDIATGMTVGTPGANGVGKIEYAAPCPPAQYEPSEHRYIFALYALDSELSLPAGASKDAVVQAMQEHIIEQTQLVGKYKRQ